MSKITEQDWLTSKDPAVMFHFLQTGGKGEDSGTELFGCPVIYTNPHPVLTDRKARLFGCACCRIETPGEQEQGMVDEYENTGVRNQTNLEWARWWATWWTEKERISTRVTQEMKANLLREIFGNPFHHIWASMDKPIAMWESIQTWHSGLIPSMTQAIYDGRKWEEMPILADALEEAGYNDREILLHCRGKKRCNLCRSNPGRDFGDAWYDCDGCEGRGYVDLECPHARGCWVLDLLLGKD
jgi:hypothetical protein